MILDLFAGGGGVTLGAVRAGFEVAGSVDIDSDLLSAHAENFPGIPRLVGDLRELEPSELLRRLSLGADGISGITGGPPCQGFSHIGARDPEDPRNGLVDRYFKCVAEICPDFFLFENVPGILTESARPILDAAIAQITDLYDLAGPSLLNAKDFGAPTQRVRVVVLGIRKGLGGPLMIHCSPRARAVTVRDAIADLPSPIKEGAPTAGDRHWAAYPGGDGRLSDYAKRMRRRPPRGLGSQTARTGLRSGLVSGCQATRHSTTVRRRFASVLPGERETVSRFPRLEWERPAPTLRAGTGSDRGSFQAARPIHPEEPRVITVREAARIQGFPDWFAFHPTKWHSFRMIGNSVSPILAEALLRRVRKHLYSGGKSS